MVTERIGLLLQVAGLVAIVVGIGLWLGAAGACIAAGLAAAVIGTLLELQPEEVTIDAEGSGETD